jgi:hypothetical protein
VLTAGRHRARSQLQRLDCTNATALRAVMIFTVCAISMVFLMLHASGEAAIVPVVHDSGSSMWSCRQVSTAPLRPIRLPRSALSCKAVATDRLQDATPS